MPCQHCIGKTSMIGLLNSLIASKQFEIKCPYKNENGESCNQIWDFKLCSKVGVFTKDESKIFESKLSENYLQSKAKTCPSCGFYGFKPK